MCVRELSKKNCRVSRQDRVWQSTDCPSNNTIKTKLACYNQVAKFQTTLQSFSSPWDWITDCIGKIRDYILEKYVFLGALF